MSSLSRSSAQASAVAGDASFAAYVIEHGGAPAGILVRDGERFRFFAASRDFGLLEGSRFSSPGAAEKAVARMRAAARRA